MKTILCLLTLLFVSTISVATADDAAFSKWDKDIAVIENRIQSGESPQGSIMFVGSSSIRLWNVKEAFPEFATSNHGFGGSQMADSVYFFERIVAPVKPSVIVVYAGDNDIAQKKTPQVVADDFTQFAEKVKKQLPDCRKVIYLAIKPSVKRWALAENIKATNQLIQTRCEKDDRLQFLDVWTPMLDAGGLPRPELLLKDGLYMSPEGPLTRNRTLEPALK